MTEFKQGDRIYDRKFDEHFDYDEKRDSHAVNTEPDRFERVPK